MTSKRSGEKVWQINNEKTFEVQKAIYEPDLQFLDLDESSQVFYATVDRVMFETPVEIVKKVLNANGYVLNLENILACLDSFRVIRRLVLKGGSQTATHFSPAISFSLPARQSTGDLLGAFYEEMSRYVDEISKLKISVKPGDKNKPEILKDDYQALLGLNQELQARISVLSKELGALRASHSAEGGEGGTLPESVKQGKVRSINYDERVVIIGLGRVNIKMSFSRINQIVEIGDPCLVAFDGGVASQVLFYENKRRPFKMKIAVVLFVERQTVKIRDQHRKTWVLSGSTEDEKTMIEGFKRGDFLLLSLQKEKIAKFEPIQLNRNTGFAEKFQEDSVIAQIVMENVNELEADLEDPSLREMNNKVSNA